MRRGLELQSVNHSSVTCSVDDGRRFCTTLPASGLRLPGRVNVTSLVVSLSLLALLLRVVNIGDAADLARRGIQRLVLGAELPLSVDGRCRPTRSHPPFYYSLLKLWRSLPATALPRSAASQSSSASPRSRIIAAIAMEQERQRPTGRPLLRAGLASSLQHAHRCSSLIGQEARPYPLLTFAYAIAILGLFRLQAAVRGRRRRHLAFLVPPRCRHRARAWAHGLGVLYGIALALAFAPSWLLTPNDRGRICRGVLRRWSRRAALPSVLADDRQPRRRLGHQLARLAAEHCSFRNCWRFTLCR